MLAYYKEHSQKLIKDLDAFLKQAKPILLSMDVNNIEKVIADTREKFIGYLEEFPFIGGDANSHTSNLVQAAWAAAIYERQRSKMNLNIIFSKPQKQQNSIDSPLAFNSLIL